MKKAFTLVEMIIVVSIVMILFLLTIPNINKVLSNVENKGCLAQVKVIDAAILEFKLEFDIYPDDVVDLVNSDYISSDQTTCRNGSNIIIINGEAHEQ